MDNKGTLIIKELSLSVSKAYTNTCNSIYSLQIPDYIIQNNNDSYKTLKLIMPKNSNFIYILCKNYLGHINNKFELENYIIYNDNEHKYDDNILFSKGNMNYLITSYQSELIIYEINQIKSEKVKIDKTNLEKEKIVYNIIDDNSGIVECNGNLICKLLFNTFTNNKYTINTLYITCMIIIISTVYYFRTNSQKSKNYKTFKEDETNKEEKGQFSKMFEKMKNINNFEMFSDYKKRQRNNMNNNRQEEEYKDYYGDEDDNNDNNEKDNDIEENDDEFLSKAYHNYVNNMMKNKMEKNDNDNENDYEDVEDEYEEDDNYMENNQGNNRHHFEERKGHSSDDN